MNEPPGEPPGDDAASDDAASDDESDYVNTSESDVGSDDVKLIRRSCRKATAPKNYVACRVDTTFNDRPGYTHFGRSRKGGDFRPRQTIATAPKLPATITKTVTMHNFFAAAGNCL